MGVTYQARDQQITYQLLLRRKYLIVSEGGVRELNQQELAQFSAQQQLPAQAMTQPQQAQVMQQASTQQQQLLDDVFYVISINLANPINVHGWSSQTPAITLAGPINIHRWSLALPTPQLPLNPVNVHKWSLEVPTPQLPLTPASRILLNEDALQTMGLVKNEQIMRIVGMASVINRGLKALEELIGSKDFVDFLNGRLGPKVDKAVIVLWDLPDNTHHDFIRELLLRRMRELGSEPSLVRSIINEANSVSNDMRTDVKVSSNVNQLLMIKCNLILEKHDKEGVVRKAVADWFMDRLRELMSRAGSVYVTITCEDITAMNVINRELRDFVINRLHAPFIELKPQPGVEFNKLAYLINGITPLSNASDKFDDAFGNALMQYNSKLNDIAGRYSAPINRGENESAEHFKLKAFVYHYLVKSKFNGKLEDAIDRVQTEYQVCNGVRADVAIGSEVYEVETLFSEGAFGFKKVQESIMKYRGCGVSKVHVVLEPLTTVMHLGELWDVMEYVNTMRKRGSISFEVNIEVIDAENEELAPLRDFIRRLGEALP